MNKADRDVALGSHLLRGVPDKVSLSLLEKPMTRNYARGESIFVQGDPAKFIGIVLGGRINTVPPQAPVTNCRLLII